MSGTSILQSKKEPQHFTESMEEPVEESQDLRSKKGTKKGTKKKAAKPAKAKSLIQTGSSPNGLISKQDMLAMLEGIKAAEEAGKLAELQPELKDSKKPSAFKKSIASLVGSAAPDTQGSVAPDPVTREEEEAFLAGVDKFTTQSLSEQQQAGAEQEEVTEEVSELLPPEVQQQVDLMQKQGSKGKAKMHRGEQKGKASKEELQAHYDRISKLVEDRLTKAKTVRKERDEADKKAQLDKKKTQGLEKVAKH